MTKFIVNKGSIPLSYKVKIDDGFKLVVLKTNLFLNELSDDLYEKLTTEFKEEFEKKVLTEKNPTGIFIISDKKSTAEGLDKETKGENNAGALIEPEDEKHGEGTPTESLNEDINKNKKASKSEYVKGVKKEKLKENKVKAQTLSEVIEDGVL